MCLFDVFVRLAELIDQALISIRSSVCFGLAITAFGFV